MKNKIELFLGPFGCGKTEALAKKYKEIKSNSTKNVIFFTMDELYYNFIKDYDIQAVPFSKLNKFVNDNCNYIYFIDNVDMLILGYGVIGFQKILDNSLKLYISSVSSSFYECVLGNINYFTSNIEISIQKYLENINGVKIHNMLLKNNLSISKDYVRAIKKAYGYEEV